MLLGFDCDPRTVDRREIRYSRFDLAARTTVRAADAEHTAAKPIKRLSDMSFSNSKHCSDTAGAGYVFSKFAFLAVGTSLDEINIDLAAVRIPSISMEQSKNMDFRVERAFLTDVRQAGDLVRDHGLDDDPRLHRAPTKARSRVRVRDEDAIAS